MQLHTSPQSGQLCGEHRLLAPTSVHHVSATSQFLSRLPGSQNSSASVSSRHPEAARRGSTMTTSSSSRNSSALETSDSYTIDASSTRPWHFDLPSMDAMRTDDAWPDTVTDWELFWTRFTVWQDFVSYKQRKDSKGRPQHEEWWELTDLTWQHVQEVVDIVAERIPQIVQMGVPIPEHIPFNLDNVIPDPSKLSQNQVQLDMFALDKDIRKERAQRNMPEEEDETPYWEIPPWLRFDAWDFRAYMEKKRAAQAMRKDFMKRQAQVSKYRSMNVSTMTDARVHSNYVVQTGEVPVRHSHEEYMDLITNGGKSVHPSKVRYTVKDPLEKADWFQAGAHSIPETEDFLRMIGHFADDDHDLHAFEEEGASSMLNETFEDFETESGDNQPFAMDSSLGGAPAAGLDAPAEAGGDVSGDVSDPEGADADGENE